ncbi:unnamed protein product [Amoebophrya sp. A120]|nr:unnamed protein product [Amoebophrya sp. A120]|eukprot:GSA120T00016380001.1
MINLQIRRSATRSSLLMKKFLKGPRAASTAPPILLAARFYSLQFFSESTRKMSCCTRSTAIENNEADHFIKLQLNYTCTGAPVSLLTELLQAVVPSVYRKNKKYGVQKQPSLTRSFFPTKKSLHG